MLPQSSTSRWMKVSTEFKLRHSIRCYLHTKPWVHLSGGRLPHSKNSFHSVLYDFQHVNFIVRIHVRHRLPWHVWHTCEILPHTACIRLSISFSKLFLLQWSYQVTVVRSKYILEQLRSTWLLTMTLVLSSTILPRGTFKLRSISLSCCRWRFVND